jgi:LmbE family N-acetylglucosaminyl deacetylase
MKTVLVIATHPDDEILGCGGTLARHVAEGDQVFSVIVCEGESIRYSTQNVHQSDAIVNSGKVIGIKQNYHLRFPDQKLDTFSLIDVIVPLEKIVREIKPQIVYIQFGGDINRDHKIVFEAALVALRPIESYIETILSYYTVGSTDWGYPRNFVPDTWINIVDYLEIKQKAFACYISEVKDYPHPRSFQAVNNLAFYAGNQVSLEAAEAYVTIRRVNR